MQAMRSAVDLMDRRGFLTGILALAAAPAIIRTPGLIMPIKPRLQSVGSNINTWGEALNNVSITLPARPGQFYIENTTGHPITIRFANGQSQIFHGWERADPLTLRISEALRSLA